ncbi:MAG: hypothetical protein F9K23_02780 [Bacteroidetes bacterium]|nr:MAG: hypothetical protein F9K23_02780 [Bacteroidota bacterium]
MKKTLQYTLALVAALVCLGTFVSVITQHPPKTIAAAEHQGDVLEKECTIQAEDWSVSSAENRLTTHYSPTNKTNEDYAKRKKQKLILAVCSQIKFSVAKAYSINEFLTSKRKSETYSIITVNKQLRL